ncbi:M16 family metallopeptidase [Rubrivirga sp.]|uniref:M16 family metallopeptidase n=1 Tax=Rubrivirga sp. TaxID=1885344 RepID=UPI003B52B8A6
MRRLLTVLVLAVPLAVAAQAPAVTVDVDRFQLDNGLDVILHRDASVPTVTVNTWYHVGSGREAPGRTGFAHLFEHLMFEGSGHVPEGAIDTWLEEAGGGANGSTTRDRTNYTTDAATNGLELALYLDADRMASLLDAMSPESVDGQRDVVKNERRQSYENRPYGLAFSVLGQTLYPASHPYHWPTIGSMDDLSAASYDDVVDFFRTYYTPNNASVVVAGDIDLDETRALVQKWYGSIPSGPEPPLQPIATPTLDREHRLVLEDAVQLPRLYLAWHAPAAYAPADAAMQALAGVLAGGKNSRLYRRLVYELEIAQDVSAFQDGDLHSGTFYVVATARPGHTLDEIEAVIAEELAAVRSEAPDGRELARVVNGVEASFLDGLETVDGFRGKADQLNAYLFFTGTPDFFEEDLGRFRALSPRDLTDAAMTFLTDRRVALSIVPEGAAELALTGSETAVPLF